MLLENSRWLAVAKPPGRVVVPGRGPSEGLALRAQLEQQLSRPVWVVHRLDRDTSGALLFALDAAAHRALSMAFEAGRIEKYYGVLVQGRLTSALEIARALVAARRGRMRTAKPGEGGKPAVTRVRPLETFAQASWVEAQPLTGRTHQIRVHLRSEGFPLLVDHQYGRAAPVTAQDLGGGGETIVLARTPLHCARMVVPALEDLPGGEVEAPLPADMIAALELLRAASR